MTTTTPLHQELIALCQRAEREAITAPLDELTDLARRAATAGELRVAIAARTLASDIMRAAGQALAAATADAAFLGDARASGDAIAIAALSASLATSFRDLERWRELADAAAIGLDAINRAPQADAAPLAPPGFLAVQLTLLDAIASLHRGDDGRVDQALDALHAAPPWLELRATLAVIEVELAARTAPAARSRACTIDLIALVSACIDAGEIAIACPLIPHLPTEPALNALARMAARIAAHPGGAAARARGEQIAVTRAQVLLAAGRLGEAAEVASGPALHSNEVSLERALIAARVAAAAAGHAVAARLARAAATAAEDLGALGIAARAHLIAATALRQDGDIPAARGHRRAGLALARAADARRLVAELIAEGYSDRPDVTAPAGP